MREERPPAMNRRFTLLDAIVLMAALSFAMAVSIVNWKTNRTLRLWEAEGDAVSYWRRWGWYDSFGHAVLSGCLGLGAIAVALVALRLRQPRPRLNRLLLQPGTAACAGILLGSLWEWLTNAARVLGAIVFIHWDIREQWDLICGLRYVDSGTGALSPSAVAIAAMWISLAFTRRSG
jgi:hypothetical protein